MVTLNVRMTGDKELVAGFRRAFNQVQDFRPVFLEILKDFRKTVDKTFRRGGSPKWAPLNPQYAAWKKKRYPGKGILELKGQLRASLTGTTAYSDVDIEKKNASFETKDPVAHLHQDGTRRKLPKREFVKITAHLRRKWTEMMVDHVYSTLNESLPEGEGKLRVGLRDIARRRRR